MKLLCSQIHKSILQVRPAGFLSNGKPRLIKNTTLLSKMRMRCDIKLKDPKLAVCITMYNEDESELKNTLKGVI